MLCLDHHSIIISGIGLSNAATILLVIIIIILVSSPILIYFYFFIPQNNRLDIKIEDLRLNTKSMSKNDSIYGNFQVKNKENIFVEGLYVQMNIVPVHEKLNVFPFQIQIEELGPKGKSAIYTFEIVSENAPAGQFNFQIFLYDENNNLLDNQQKQILIESN